jgi:hypothetical protein
MPTRKVATGIRLDEIAWAKITYIAKLEHRSFNSQIEHLVEQCIGEFEKKNGALPSKINE